MVVMLMKLVDDTIVTCAELCTALCCCIVDICIALHYANKTLELYTFFCHCFRLRHSKNRATFTE